MALTELATQVDAPIERVFDLARSMDAHMASTEGSNERAVAGRTSGLIEDGETVTWEARHFGVKQRLSVRVTKFDRPHLFADEMISGAFSSMHHTHRFTVLDFKMQHWQERLASLSLPAGAPVRFWVMDESRFGLHTAVRHCWGPRGTRVIKPFQQRFDWEYLYGAVDLLSGEPVFCHMPTVSGGAVWTFLGELVQTDPGAHHVILWDGAGFHQPPPAGAQEWAALAKVHVLKLPPYCPELNPTEKIWDQVKDALCNRVFGTIEAMQEGMLPKLREFWENPLGLSSLIGNNWLRHQVNASYPVVLPAFK